MPWALPTDFIGTALYLLVMKEEGLSMAREHREANSDFYFAMGRAEHAGSFGVGE